MEFCINMHMHYYFYSGVEGVSSVSVLFNSNVLLLIHYSSYSHRG